MGGLAGRADAMFGAVECQKSNGSLHYHFWLFVQRLHQFATLAEIAELLAAKLVHATELKDFLGKICCETYADVAEHQANVEALEANFPNYSEQTECQGEQVWGDLKLGRLPAFLYTDAALVDEARPLSTQEDTASDLDAQTFRKSFNAAFQYFQERCQHHIHKLIAGKRVVPNACRSKTNPNECKHGAPWINRVSPAWMTEPLLVCKGIARKFKLRCSGARNWLGQILGCLLYTSPSPRD